MSEERDAQTIHHGAYSHLANLPCELCDEASLRSRLSQAEEERDRLKGALLEGQVLIEEMDRRMPEHATEDEDGFINSYRIPTGPWHRLLGWKTSNYVPGHARLSQAEEALRLADSSLTWCRARHRNEGLNGRALDEAILAVTNITRPRTTPESGR